MLLPLILALVGLPVGARAACPEPLTSADFRAHVDTAQQAIDEGDVIAHGRAWRELSAGLECLQTAVPAADWARFLVGYAVVEHALGRSWQPALATALAVDPSVPLDYGPAELRTFTPPPPGATVPLLDGTWLDGRPARVVPPELVGPHILQRETATGWLTVVVTDGRTPSEWVDEPPLEVPRRSAGPVLQVVGWTAAGVGAAAVGTTWAMARNEDAEWTERSASTVRTVNLAGWGLCGLGLGTAVLGHLQKPVALTAAPGRIGVHGRF